MGELHGYGIVLQIQRASEELLRVEVRIPISVVGPARSDASQNGSYTA